MYKQKIERGDKLEEKSCFDLAPGSSVDTQVSIGPSVLPLDLPFSSDDVPVQVSSSCIGLRHSQPSASPHFHPCLMDGFDTEAYLDVPVVNDAIYSNQLSLPHRSPSLLRPLLDPVSQLFDCSVADQHMDDVSASIGHLNETPPGMTCVVDVPIQQSVSLDGLLPGDVPALASGASGMAGMIRSRRGRHTVSQQARPLIVSTGSLSNARERLRRAELAATPDHESSPSSTGNPCSGLVPPPPILGSGAQQLPLGGSAVFPDLRISASILCTSAPTMSLPPEPAVSPTDAGSQLSDVAPHLCPPPGPTSHVDHINQPPSFWSLLIALLSQCYVLTSGLYFSIVGTCFEPTAFGSPDVACPSCGAFMWAQENVSRHRRSRLPLFSLCCKQGKVDLPPRRPTPPFLDSLLDPNGGPTSRSFRENIRVYNSLFQFTSLGGEIDNSVNNGSGPYIFRLNNRTYHKIDPLLPPDGSRPRFAQLYIYDCANEVSNRVNAVTGGRSADTINQLIVEGLLAMFDSVNEVVKLFRMAKERIDLDSSTPVRIRLVKSRGSEPRTYSLPTTVQISGLIVGDFGRSSGDRDVIVDHRNGTLQHISTVHPLYMALQYPILFPYDEDGFTPHIRYRDFTASAGSVRQTLSMRDYYAYQLQQRSRQGETLLRGGRLFQQFCIDALSSVQEDLIHQGDADVSDVGKRIILPASFIGSPRYLYQKFQDAMAICRAYGYPDLFITFTCQMICGRIGGDLCILGFVNPIYLHQILPFSFSSIPVRPASCNPICSRFLCHRHRRTALLLINLHGQQSGSSATNNTQPFLFHFRIGPGLKWLIITSCQPAEHFISFSDKVHVLVTLNVPNAYMTAILASDQLPHESTKSASFFVCWISPV
ncbi:hypothetical protein COLO4_06468 [Corchorus olitorius]|uniref:Helitron helicase-like domain-containing protein n=1 Tax=Corchorus olitorius TaxID=93759 RepID=A0A1R3KMY6_9ROSI|nr:hypothetical protein COLO4_06468 [Corchorus olitorius]